MQRHAYYYSPLGQILITAEDDAVVSLVFADTDAAKQHLSNPLLKECHDWLDAYFAGSNPDPWQIPLKLTGTPFQQKIWAILKQIPYGQSITYGEIAAQISPSMSAQAVGQAVGSNPVSIIIPCHRVLGAGGKLTGYAYGIERKQWLLALEKIPYLR